MTNGYSVRRDRHMMSSDILQTFQYGFVFGITHLAAFLSGPFFGRYGNIIGPKILYNTGAFVQAICAILFGFLDYLDKKSAFLGLSYVLRLI